MRKLKLKCHCGYIEAEIGSTNFEKNSDAIVPFCKRKGAIMAMVKNENFKILKRQR